MSRRNRVLITGGDGYVGCRVAQHLLATSDHSLLLLVRASDARTLGHKRAHITARLGTAEPRVVIEACDLTQPDAFAQISSSGISAIIHAAAATRFNVGRVDAKRVNVEGTEAVLRFAEHCRSLDSITLLSTLYASGLLAGSIPEQPIDTAPEFANHYEWSKWQAETLAVRDYDHLPWQICRLATIIADDADGRVVQRNVFHRTLRVYRHGLLSLVPGNPKTPLYFITGDYAAKAIASVMSRGPRRAVFHVCNTGDNSISLGETISTAFAQFAEEADFRRKRILPPLFTDLESFGALSVLASGFTGEMVRQATSGILPFAPQLFVSKDVANRRLTALCPDHTTPDPRELVVRTCRSLQLVCPDEARHAA